MPRNSSNLDRGDSFFNQKVLSNNTSSRSGSATAHLRKMQRNSAAASRAAFPLKSYQPPTSSHSSSRTPALQTINQTKRSSVPDMSLSVSQAFIDGEDKSRRGSQEPIFAPSQAQKHAQRPSQTSFGLRQLTSNVSPVLSRQGARHNNNGGGAK